MTTHITRSITKPIREDLETVADIWDGPDKGLIFCWEQGRLEREQKPDLAERATRGELVTVGHRTQFRVIADDDVNDDPEQRQDEPDSETNSDEDDVADDSSEEKKSQEHGIWKRGSLQYLAWWQGLRGEDLNVSPLTEIVIVCPRVFVGQKGKMKDRKFRRQYTFPRKGKTSKPRWL